MIAVVVMVGCGQSEDQNEKWINRIIAVGMGERAAGIDSAYSDYTVYRDGNNDGVCYEFIFSEDLSEDARGRFAGALKGGLVPTVRTQIAEGDQELKTAMENGVYLRFIYKTPDGRVIGDQIISFYDL